MSDYNPKKAEALRAFLEKKEAKVPFGTGWRAMRCINSDFHTHQDKVPSASVHMGMGRYKCHACDLSGDVYDLMVQLGEVPNLKEALAGKAKEVEEPTWI